MQGFYIYPTLRQQTPTWVDASHSYVSFLLLQRIGHSTRRGGPHQLKLEVFADALHDKSAQLTMAAFTGQRKQSIQDVENLFSEEFMERNGHAYEAMYIKTIRNWRLSCDERGLTQLRRCKYNYQMLNFILEELMPWYNEKYDFSTLEVTR